MTTDQITADDRVRRIAKEIVAREGGYVNDPDDPGGATNFGVTLGTMQRLGLDLDGDGDLDLFLGHGGPGETPPEPGGLNGVFLNRGDLTFDDVSDRLSEEQRDGYTQVGTLVDMDLDGDVDFDDIDDFGNQRTGLPRYC